MRSPIAGGTALVLVALAGSLVAQAPSAHPVDSAPFDAALIGPANRLDAAQDDTLRLADLIDQARRDNPMLLATRLQVDAALERVPQRGA